VGEWFGEVGLLEEKVVNVDIVADSPVRLLAFEREHFETVLGNLKDLIDRQADNRMLSELPIITKIPEERVCMSLSNVWCSFLRLISLSLLLLFV
jgi:CRP-like cAMP-binding protein